MPDRTTRTTATFKHPFSLRSLDGVQSPGTYVIETDEELILGLSFDAYRRTNTYLFLPSTGVAATATQIVNVDPAELQTALDADAMIDETSAPVGPSQR